MYSISFSTSACLRRFLPVGFILSPIRIGLAPNSTVCVYDETTVISLSEIDFGEISPLDFTSSPIYSGVVPQQPPATRTPRLMKSETSFAKSTASTSKTVFPSTTLGSPAFGFTSTGTEALSRSSYTTSRS